MTSPSDHGRDVRRTGQRDGGRVRQRPHEEEAIKKSGENHRKGLDEGEFVDQLGDELMAALLTTDEAGLRRLVADTCHVIGPKGSTFVLFERCEAAHDRFTVRAPCRAQRGLVRRSAYPLSAPHG